MIRSISMVRKVAGSGSTVAGSMFGWQRRLSPMALCGLDGSRLGGKDQALRAYHRTQRQEIVPLVAAAAVLFVGHYSWRAIRRMDEEWEDYHWKLQQYEKDLVARADASVPVRKTIAIDIGTVFTKLAGARSNSQPEVIISREGDRAVFSGVALEDDDVLSGRAAMERFFYSITEKDEVPPITLPWVALLSLSANRKKVVEAALKGIVNEAADRLDYITADKPSPSIRHVVTIPVNMMKESTSFREAFTGIATYKHQTTLVPEAIAAIWGAQSQSILPPDTEPGKKVVVIDVGGLVTQLSIVHKDRILSSMSIPWGGESLIQLGMEFIKQESESTRGHIQDARSLAALHAQVRAAILELSIKSRVALHVPYLFADPSNHHLNTELSKPVLEQMIQQHVKNHLVQDIQKNEVLSPHLPLPTNLTTLWTSLLTQLLEKSSMSPFGIDHLLVVGAGAKSSLMTQSLQSACSTLMGPEAMSKMIIPPKDVIGELTVLGATRLLPSYEYSIEEGALKRTADDKY